LGLQTLAGLSSVVDQRHRCRLEVVVKGGGSHHSATR
jgi:hypothetical protein